MKKRFVLSLIFLVSLFGLASQESENLEDSLFGGDEPIVQDVETANEESRAVLEKRGLGAELKTRNVTAGGELEAGMDVSAIWRNVGGKRASSKPDASFLNTLLRLDLYLDARPRENLKIKGAVELAYPFEKALLVSGKTTEDGKDVAGAALGALNFRVKELYTDFSIKDIAFLRFGKCAAKWGTGYFYSPSDVINISRIDPEHPERAREGAVHFRSHFIIPKTNYNFYAYFLPPLDPTKIEESAFAASAEGVFGGFELSLGGWWRYQKAPRVSFTMSGTLFQKLAIFAEGVYSYGSDYTYFADGASYTKKTASLFQATVGASYSISKTHTMIAAQYYYNGLGYARHTDYENALKTVSGNPLFAREAGGAMPHAGSHYVAFSITQSKIGTDRLSASLFEEFRITERVLNSSFHLMLQAHENVHFDVGFRALTPLVNEKAGNNELALTFGVTFGGGKF